MPPDTPKCPECQSNQVEYIASHNSYLCSNKHFFQVPEITDIPLRVFLSYGRDDKAFIAVKIKEELEKAGYEVWYDLSRLQVGKDWEHYIDDGLDWVAQAGEGARFLLLMTPHSVRRPDGFCLNELARAIARNISVFPVMVEWCEMPLCICRSHWLDLRQGYLDDRITGKFPGIITELKTALAQNRKTFEGEFGRLDNILSPLSFEQDAIFHLKHFEGRDWIKERIDQWLKNDLGNKIFWLTGGPGAGKTAIASYLQYYHPAVKSFFLCKAPGTPLPEGVYEPGDPRWCVRTIAYHLAVMIPEYSKRLLQQQDLVEKTISECSAHSIFERLITEMLHGVNLPHNDFGQRAIILIDGLDEVTRDERNVLASFLVTNIPKTPDWLRVLILSRSEPPLPAILERYSPWEIDKEKKHEKDVRSFIEKQLLPLTAEGVLPIGLVNTILQKSEGNFLYVERLREALEKKDINIDELHRFPIGLGGTYYQWLERRFPSVGDFRREYFDTIAILCTVTSPLNLEEAEIIFNWTKGYELKEFQEHFGALFRYDNEQIVPFHQSFVEWITSIEAGGFQVNAERGHGLLAALGYEAFQNRHDLVNSAQQRFLRELPDHLLALKRERHIALKRLEEFLTSHDIFASYFSENLYSFISYWNAFCRANHEKHLSLRDCPASLEKNYEQGSSDRGVSDKDWEICRAIGRLYFELHDHKNAVRMYERASQILPPHCPEAAKASLYNAIGETYCHKEDARDLTQAQKYYSMALEIRRRLHPTGHPDLAESICCMGHVFAYREDYDAALPYYQEALEMWRRLPSIFQYEEADYLNNLAVVFYGKGEKEEAEGYYQQAIAILDQAEITYWGVPVVRGNYADFLAGTGRAEEALVQYKKTYEYTLKLYGPEHERTIEYATKLAGLYQNLSRFTEAAEIFLELKETLERIYGSSHPKLPHNLNLLANCYHFQKQYVKAEHLYQQAIEVAKKVLGPEHQDTLTFMENLANNYGLQNKHDLAETIFQDCLAIREKALAPDHPDILALLTRLAHSYYQQTKYDLAEPYFSRLVNRLEIDQENKNSKSNLAQNLNWLANCHFFQRHYDQAIPLYKRAIKIAEEVQGVEHSETITFVENLANTYYQQGQHDQAETLFRSSLAIRERVLGPVHRDIAAAQFNLAQKFRELGKHDQAAPLYRTLLDRQEDLLTRGENLDQDLLDSLATAHNNLAFHTLVPQGSLAEAEDRYRRAIELFAQAGKDQQAVNSEINLLWVQHLAGKYVDRERVAELTRILEETGDSRAEKGYKLLEELTSDDDPGGGGPQ